MFTNLINDIVPYLPLVGSIVAGVGIGVFGMLIRQPMQAYLAAERSKVANLAAIASVDFAAIKTHLEALENADLPGLENRIVDIENTLHDLPARFITRV
jgi:hypothetical protein